VRCYSVAIPITVPIGKANSSITAPIIMIIPQFVSIRNAIANIKDRALSKINNTPNSANILPTLRGLEIVKKTLLKSSLLLNLLKKIEPI